LHGLHYLNHLTRSVTLLESSAICVVEAMMTGETYLAAQACKLASCCLANVAIRLLKAMIAMTGFIRIPSVPVSGGHNDDASAARRVFGRRGLGIAARRWKHTM